MKTAAIIGGGFSGTVAAVHLARLAPSALRIVLINSGYPAGQGVAYSTMRPEHVLNVPARIMSALDDEPDHFVKWLRARPEFVHDETVGEQYVERRLFGQYLLEVLGSHERIEIVSTEATEVTPDASRFRIALTGRESLTADAVVLATGNAPPADLPGLPGFAHPRFISNPWNDWIENLRDKDETVVLIGGGLTMVDAFLTLSSIGWTGPIVAVSRTGLWPQSNFPAFLYRDFPESDPVQLGLTALVASMEEHCRRVRTLGKNPAVVVDNLRPFTQRIFQNFSLDEKRRFCAEYRTRWGAARHRIAPEVYEQVEAGLARGRLRNCSGHVAKLIGHEQAIRVEIDTTSGQEVIDAGWVFNCTGPQESWSNSKAPLMRNLLASGFVQPDDLDLGLRVTADFAVVDRDRNASRPIFAIGPLMRGTLWETVAVPEIRGQGHSIAKSIVANI